MGGYGSGWHRYDKKRCVEDGLTLRASGFKGIIEEAHEAGGYVTGRTAWGTSKSASRIGFTYWPGATSPDALAEAGGGSPGRLRLTYDRVHGTDREPVGFDIGVEVRACYFGGWRIYFRCPLTPDGRACGRRCEKVYLPPGARYFGCRTCHGLTYRSAQEAHQFDGLFRRLGAEMGMNPRDVERALTARF